MSCPGRDWKLSQLTCLHMQHKACLNHHTLWKRSFHRFSDQNHLHVKKRPFWIQWFLMGPSIEYLTSKRNGSSLWLEDAILFFNIFLENTPFYWIVTYLLKDLNIQWRWRKSFHYILIFLGWTEKKGQPTSLEFIKTVLPRKSSGTCSNKYS